MEWQNVKAIAPRSYVCGHCGNKVGSNHGWHTSGLPPSKSAIHVCPHCSRPSIFLGDKQWPGVAPGNSVDHLPNDVAALYEEARSAVAASAHTAAVLACRKLLMNIAVALGAAPGQSFISYVEHLANTGYIPPNGKQWVDHIRQRGNEATHEIQLMSATDSLELIAFAEMLLKFVFEFPARVPKKP